MTHSRYMKVLLADNAFRTFIFIAVWSSIVYVFSCDDYKMKEARQLH